jgi:EAL domain-containing protein (putative c-di-GMP-specific phosphodiesterase class I)
MPNGELEVYYQPQFDLQAGKIKGAEALIRWNDPERGLISPADFLPIAEETGLIQPMSEWIVAEACRACREWQRVRSEGLQVAVNASGSWLLQLSMAEVVKRAIEESGLDPKHLEIEITEDVILGDAKASSAALKRLKDLGVSVALDDFGTGYSSLSHLQKFPVDAIKIDRSFVANVPDAGGDATIVKTLVALGNTLNLRVIAEGVETDAQMEFLRREQCRLAQGYLIGRPQPNANFVELLK